MISYQRLSTYPRFETEVQGYSEMAYLNGFLGGAQARQPRAAEHHG